MYTKAQTAAIEAIKGYQDRSLFDSSIYDEYRRLLEDVGDMGGYDYGYNNMLMKTICIETLAAFANPTVRAHYSEHLQDALPKALMAMHNFFDNLHQNTRVEADMELSYVTEYVVSDEDCMRAAKEYSNKTEGCKPECVRVVAPVKIDMPVKA